MHGVNVNAKCSYDTPYLGLSFTEGRFCTITMAGPACARAMGSRNKAYTLKVIGRRHTTACTVRNVRDDFSLANALLDEVHPGTSPACMCL